MKTIDNLLTLSLATLSLSTFAVDSKASSTEFDLVIYDNGGVHSQGLGILSDAGSDPTIVLADDFTLESGLNIITDYHWFGAYSDSAVGLEPEDSFSILILDDLNGSPNNAVEMPIQFASIERQLTGEVLISGQPIYEYWIQPGDSIKLKAGRPYWISIFNETPGGEWFWIQSNNSGNAHVNFDPMLDPSDWEELSSFDVSSEMAFSLTGPPRQIPEPGMSIGILSVGSLITITRFKPNRN